jgi:hypothetical protein
MPSIRISPSLQSVSSYCTNSWEGRVFWLYWGVRFGMKKVKFLTKLSKIRMLGDNIHLGSIQSYLFFCIQVKEWVINIFIRNSLPKRKHRYTGEMGVLTLNSVHLNFFFSLAWWCVCKNGLLNDCVVQLCCLSYSLNPKNEYLNLFHPIMLFYLCFTTLYFHCRRNAPSIRRLHSNRI